MFELKEIKKTYNVGDVETKALDGISVAFREKNLLLFLEQAVLENHCLKYHRWA